MSATPSAPIWGVFHILNSIGRFYVADQNVSQAPSPSTQSKLMRVLTGHLWCATVSAQVPQFSFSQEYREALASLDIRDLVANKVLYSNKRGLYFVHPQFLAANLDQFYAVFTTANEANGRRETTVNDKPSFLRMIAINAPEGYRRLMKDFFPLALSDKADEGAFEDAADSSHANIARQRG